MNIDRNYYWRNHQNGRYYRLYIARDLLGHRHIIRTWGGKSTDRHGVLDHLVDTDADATRIVKSILTQRKRRGYALQTAEIC